MTTGLHRSDRSRKRRTDITYTVGVILLVAVLAWIVITIQSLSADLHQAIEDRDALAKQVRHLGAVPVAGPRGKPGQAGTSPPGQKGDRGERGEPGPTSTVRGPRGPEGSPGPSGPPGTGAPGEPGADSTVPGPAGSSGRDGTDGQNGRDGKDGADGHDGQTCPAGYDLQPDPNNPDNLVCRRKDAADASPTPTPTESPSEAPLLPSILTGRGR